MSSTNFSRISVVLILLALAGCPPAGATADEQSHTAAVLLSEYETVFFTSADLSSHFSAFKGLSRQSASTLSLPFAYLIGALDSLDPHASADILSQTDSLLLGAKNSIPPEGEGGTQLVDFCYVAGFGAHAAPDLHKYFTTAAVSSVDGAPVWKWFAKIYGDDEHGLEMYAVQVDRSRLIFTSNIEQLPTLAAKLTSTGDANAVLNKLPDWLAVSRHEYWGYRQARHAGAIQSDAAHLEAMMPGTDTVIIFADIKSKTATVRVLGADAEEFLAETKRRDEQQRAAFARMGIHPPPNNYVQFHTSGPRTLEKTFRLASPQAEGEVLMALGLLGFEIYI